MLSLCNIRTAAAFIRTLETGSKPPSFYATHVKPLCIAYRVHTEQVAKILAACIGVRNLACWVNSPRDQVRQMLPALVTALRPRRLSMHYPLLMQTPESDVDFRVPCFQTVTHLEVCGDWPSWVSWSWTHIASVPHLTHVNLQLFQQDFDLRRIKRVLDKIMQCPTLRVCVLHVEPEEECRFFQELLEMDADDKRLVVIPCPDGWCEDWHAHVRGEPDQWSRAEVIVASRMESSGEIRSFSRPSSAANFCTKAPCRECY
jgi:hypothetical protein